jgi:hypothetical protein
MKASTHTVVAQGAPIVCKGVTWSARVAAAGGVESSSQATAAGRKLLKDDHLHARIRHQSSGYSSSPWTTGLRQEMERLWNAQ